MDDIIFQLDERESNGDMLEEWHSLLKEALLRRSYNATEKLLTLSSFFINPSNFSSPATTASTTPTTTTTTTTTATPIAFNNTSIDSNSYTNQTNIFLPPKQETDGNRNKRKHHKVIYYHEDKENRYDQSYYTVLAVKTNDARFIKLFRMYNFTIDFPHEMNCKCLLCETDQIGQSKKRVNTLQALSSPLWIALTSEDPFLTSFKISKKCRKFRAFQDCYENVYDNIIKQNREFCCSLLDHIENENEVQCLMKRNHESFNPFTNVKHLDFIRLGIKYHQKEVR